MVRSLETYNPSSKNHCGGSGKSSLEKLRACYLPKFSATTLSNSRYGTPEFTATTIIRKMKDGAYGIRTRDLLNAIEALYQLS
jgi:hypothetical protein